MSNINLSKPLAFLNYFQLLRLTLFMRGNVESSTQLKDRLDTRYCIQNTDTIKGQRRSEMSDLPLRIGTKITNHKSRTC